MKLCGVSLLLFAFFGCLCQADFIQEWTDSDLEKLSSAASNRVFLFHADWCGACNRYKPTFQSNAEAVHSKHPAVEFIKVNLDGAPDLSARFRISHIPTVFHELNGEYRKIGDYRNSLVSYFDEEKWKSIEPMGPLGKFQARPTEKRTKGFNVNEFVGSLGMTMPVFFLLVGLISMMAMMMLVFLIWLYTDYKLNRHRFTEEAIKDRIKLLNAHEQDTDEEDSDEDSGNESDSEQEGEERSSLLAKQGIRPRSKMISKLK